MSLDKHPATSEEHDDQQTLQPVITSDQLLLETMSSYNRLVRVTAWILCFINNARKRSKRNSSPILSLIELKGTEELWWQIAQRSSFQNEIYNLENGNALSLRSKILPFQPFLDERGLLVIGRGLEKAGLLFEKCHPCAITWNHKISRLLNTAEHLCLKHAGPTLVYLPH